MFSVVYLHPLLLLQTLYAVAGFFYNLASLYRIQQMRRPLAPTRPSSGLLAMLIYLLVPCAAASGYWLLYRILAALALLVLGYSGIVAHWLRRRHINRQYASAAAWYWAIGINSFGAGLNALAVLA